MVTVTNKGITLSDHMNLKAKGEKNGTVAESTELRQKYDSLLKVVYIHGCTGRLHHTDAMPKAFAKRHRLEAKPTQSLKWHSRELREKSG